MTDLDADGAPTNLARFHPLRVGNADGQLIRIGPHTSAGCRLGSFRTSSKSWQAYTSGTYG